MDRILVPLGFALVPVGLLLVFLFVGADLAGGPELLTSMTQPSLDTMNAAVDQAVAMLSSIVLGLFLIVGFALQAKAKAGIRDLPVMIGGLAFLSSAFVSLYFGYAARMQSLEFVAAGHTIYDPVMQAIGRQAVAAAVATACGVFPIVRLLMTDQEDA